MDGRELASSMASLKYHDISPKIEPLARCSTAGEDANPQNLRLCLTIKKTGYAHGLKISRNGALAQESFFHEAS